MLNSLTRATKAIVTSELGLNTCRLFRLCLVTSFLVSAIVKLPFASEYYSALAYIPQFPFREESPLAWVIELARHPFLREYYWFFVVGQLVFLSMALAGITPRLSLLLSYFFTENLASLDRVTLDGGDNLASLLLIYSVFLNTTGVSSKMKDGFAKDIAVGFHNAAFLMCRIQVALVYFASGLYKIQGELWQHGMALYYILQSSYSTPLFRQLAESFPFLTSIATYSVMGFQLSFPYLVWFRMTRAYVLAAGVIFHIGVIFVMGLFEFGLTMCLVYSVFFFDEWSALTLRRIGSWTQT